MNDLDNLIDDIDTFITTQQGYCTIAVKTEDDREVKRAVALAASTKLADPTRPFALITDKFDSVPKKYEDVFDTIIELPYGHYDPTENSLINFWQLYWASPYDQTLFLDSRCLVLNDIEHMWDSWKFSDLIFPKTAYNFKKENQKLRYAWTAHRNNDIPTYYTHACFFDKGERSLSFFKMADVVLKNFRSVYLEYVKENRPSYFDINLLLNLTLKLLGEDDNIFGDIPYTLVSLDNLQLNDSDLPQDWVEYISKFVSSSMVKVSNHRLSDIVCYNSDTFMDDEILDDYRQRYSISKRTLAAD